VFLLPAGESLLSIVRVDPSGNSTETAIPFVANSVDAVAAGTGGDAIAVVMVRRGPQSTLDDLLAVRVNADGTPARAPPSRTICSATGTQGDPAGLSDGSGGAFFAWRDARSLANGADIYATHLLANGSLAPGWPANGKAIAALAAEQTDPSLVADGSG